MGHKISVEEHLEEIDEIIRRYRAGLTQSDARETLTQEQALAQLRKLGFSSGEALRLLRPKGGRPGGA